MTPRLVHQWMVGQFSSSFFSLSFKQNAKSTLENIVAAKNQDNHSMQLRVSELEGRVAAFQMALSDRSSPSDKISLSEYVLSKEPFL
jgi:hypothetical protein